MARTYSLDGRLGKVYARGAKLEGNIAEAVTNASLSLSTSESSQLTIGLVDGDTFPILESGIFDAGTPTRRGSQLDFGNLHFEVRAIEVSPLGVDHALTITARSSGVGYLKREKGRGGRKTLSPTQYAALAAKKAGLGFIGQPSTQRKSITRRPGEGDQPGESEWDVIQRLASELGFIAFEAGDVLHFGKPTWFVDRKARLEYLLRWRGNADKVDDGLDTLPRCRRSGDDPRAASTLTAVLRGTAGDDVLPGMVAVLEGVPTFESAYLIGSVNMNLAEGSPATVEAAEPVNPKPQPPAKRVKATTSSSSTSTSSTSAATGTPAGGQGSAAAFVGYAEAQAGDTYIYGAEASASDPNPNAFDCSELVQWAAARAGVPFVDGSSAQIAACRAISVADAIATRGALLWHEGHIAISLGNGQTIEAANSRVGVVRYSAAGRFARGGLIPGLRY